MENNEIETMEDLVGLMGPDAQGVTLGQKLVTLLGQLNPKTDNQNNSETQDE